MKTPKLCFVPEKYVCVKDFSLMFFVKRTWELKTVSFTWSCSGFVFWKRLEMDLGTPSWGIYTGHLGCLPWEGDSVVRDTSEGKRTPAWTLLRIPRSSWMLISFSMTEENALALSEEALSSVMRNGVRQPHMLFLSCLSLSYQMQCPWCLMPSTSDGQYGAVDLHFTVR